MYCVVNFKTKKDLKAALRENVPVLVYNPGRGGEPQDGRAVVEGPHFPEPHRWYAAVQIKDGRIIPGSVK